MVTEVNKLIYNTLVSERSIYLPEVGTIALRRQSAQIVNKGVVNPPRYRAEFSSQQQGVSLVEIIAHATHIDVTAANDIYQRWLGRVRNGSTVIIEGVGELHNKSFVADTALLAILNVAEPLTLKRKSGKKWGIVVCLLIAVIVGLVGAYFYTTHNTAVDTDVIDQSVCEEITSDEAVPENEPVVTEHNADNVIPEEGSKEASEISREEGSEETANANLWSANPDIRHWVVVGSYSTEANANAAVDSYRTVSPEYEFHVYPLGSMYAVVVYGSADREECVRFKRSLSSRFNQAWIHTPRRYR